MHCSPPLLEFTLAPTHHSYSQAPFIQVMDLLPWGFFLQGGLAHFSLPGVIPSISFTHHFYLCMLGVGQGRDEK